MDVKQYYRKLREIEAGITDPFAFVTSLETPDGGKAGVVSEVSREQAARLILEGRAAMAETSETTAYLQKRKTDKRAFEKAELARRLQVTIVQAPENETSSSGPLVIEELT